MFVALIRVCSSIVKPVEQAERAGARIALRSKAFICRGTYTGGYGMSDSGSLALGMVAWLIAAALAAAAAGAFFGLSMLRRRRTSESRMTALEGAVAEFCESARARIGSELERARQVLRITRG